jgi:ribonuclease III
MEPERKQQLVNLLRNPVFSLGTPNDEALLRYDQAFTHSSFAKEHRDQGIFCEDNERLEFFGDCILDFIIGQELYGSFPERIEELKKHYPKKKDEALLTDMLHNLTNDEQLSAIVITIDSFDSTIRRGSGQALNESIRAGAFESFIAAVFHNRGIEKTQDIVKNVFKDRIKNATPIVSWKNRLQECVQKQVKTAQVSDIIKYDTCRLENSQVCVRVSVNGEIWGEGRADCKRDAEVEAAKDAYQHHCMNAIR